MVSPDFIYSGFTVDNSDGNSEEFPVGLIKGVSLVIFYITMLSFYEYSKLVEDIGCMEVTSLVVSNIYIKGINEANICVRKEFCDKYIPLGISE